MQKINHFWRFLFYVLTVLIIFSGCKTDDAIEDIKPVDNQYFKESTQLSSFTKEQLQAVAALGGYSNFVPMIENGIVLHKITYKTTFKGDEIEASGLVVVPDIAGTYPLLSGQHGTIFSNAQAPSAFSLSQGLSGFEFFGAGGFIAIIPDYIGFGSSKDILHPYYNSEYTASAIVDMIKAAKEFLTAEKINFTDKLFLTGYSEGGYATLAAQKSIEDKPIEGLSLVAVAAGAGGYNINGVMDEIVKNKTYDSPAYLAFIIYSYIKTNNWTEPLTDFFKEPYASKIPDLLDGSKSQGQVNAALTENLEDLFNDGFLTAIRSGARLTLTSEFSKNSVHNFVPQKPLKLYHSPNDGIIPIVNSENTAATMIASGATSVEFIATGGSSHGGAVLPMYELVIPWFQSLK